MEDLPAYMDTSHMYYLQLMMTFGVKAVFSSSINGIHGEKEHPVGDESDAGYGSGQGRDKFNCVPGLTKVWAAHFLGPWILESAILYLVAVAAITNLLLGARRFGGSSSRCLPCHNLLCMTPILHVLMDVGEEQV